MAVTIQQIAEAAGVSRGTVDRVLHNRGRVRPDIAAQVRKIAVAMGIDIIGYILYAIDIEYAEEAGNGGRIHGDFLR